MIKFLILIAVFLLLFWIIFDKFEKDLGEVNKLDDDIDSGKK